MKNAGLYSINISLDSSNELIHDKIRGRTGSFKDVINAIKNSLNAGLLVSIYCVVAKHNIDDLDNIYEFATNMNVHEISFYEIVPTGRWFKNEKNVLSEEDYYKYKHFITKNKDKNGPKIFSGIDIIKNFGCMAGNKWIHISPDGNIYPCACIPISYGNINNTTIKKSIKKMEKSTYNNSNTCLMKNKEFRKKIK